MHACGVGGPSRARDAPSSQQGPRALVVPCCARSMRGVAEWRRQACPCPSPAHVCNLLSAVAIMACTMAPGVKVDVNAVCTASGHGTRAATAVLVRVLLETGLLHAHGVQRQGALEVAAPHAASPQQPLGPHGGSCPASRKARTAAPCAAPAQQLAIAVRAGLGFTLSARCPACALLTATRAPARAARSPSPASCAPPPPSAT